MKDIRHISKLLTEKSVKKTSSNGGGQPSPNNGDSDGDGDGDGSNGDNPQNGDDPQNGDGDKDKKRRPRVVYSRPYAAPHSCSRCSNWNATGDCAKRKKVTSKHSADKLRKWLTRPYMKNACSFFNKSPHKIEHRDRVLEIAARTLWPDNVHNCSGQVFRSMVNALMKTGGSRGMVAVKGKKALAVYSTKDKTFALSFSGKKPTPKEMARIAAKMNLKPGQVDVFLFNKK